jgi:hypothetical protein
MIYEREASSQAAWRVQARMGRRRSVKDASRDGASLSEAFWFVVSREE